MHPQIILTPELLEQIRAAAIAETRLTTGDPALLLALLALANDAFILGVLKEKLSEERQD